MENIKKALVVSGGGARGAWGVGVLSALNEINNTDYDLVVGTSTGSLIAPLAAIKDYDTLKSVYLNVTQDSIFNVNPFYANGNLIYWRFAYRVLAGYSTLGESLNLLNLIRKNFTPAIYNQIKAEGKVVAATVSSLTKNRVATMTTETESLEDMVDWIWGSCNEPVFMSTLVKNGEAWVDGGLKDYLPIEYAIDRGATEIDVIVHNTVTISDGVNNWKQSGGLLNLLLRSVQIFESNVGQMDVEEAILQDRINPNIKMTFYYMNEAEVDQTQNPLIFNKPAMSDVFNQGYNSVKDGTIIKKVYPQQVAV